MKLRTHVKSFIKDRFNNFLNKRMPASSHQQLSNKNIFILPTKFGIAYLLSVLIIFLLGTNYQNNLIILVSYLFVSLFLTAMLHSFLNLTRLQLLFTSNVTTFANQSTVVPIIIKTDKPRFDLTFTFANNHTSSDQSSSMQYLVKNKVEQGESIVNVPFLSIKRGLHNTGRLKISSEYAFGLFVCWTNLDFNCVVTTYPAKKVFNSLKNNTASYHEEMNGNHIVEGGDDFGELREYKTGESNAQIAWKQLARGQGRLTKTTQQELGSTIWLSLSELPASPIETKLEMLCYLILDHHKHGIPFGLQLEGITMQPSMSHNHTQKCLATLASYKQSTKKYNVQDGVNSNV